MPNLLFAVTYQVHKPDPNSTDPTADIYRLAPVEVHVVAAAQDQATLFDGNYKQHYAATE
jgi:hypothetical protein